ncbi:hypothetical protein TorRG33x02_335460 [Trema orientale]|uniref:Uncharacterized protein n=1 Tax=Trema orientale TaxID=63057 RepID=A0A2P5B1F2_TREOI|nr:hypothetical protein TorRG33x02_335460 [Trema orientale]
MYVLRRLVTNTIRHCSTSIIILRLKFSYTITSMIMMMEYDSV